MSQLEQLKKALEETIHLTKSEAFKEYSVDEQNFFRGYVRELSEEISAEYEAMEFVRQRDKEKLHEAV